MKILVYKTTETREYAAFEARKAVEAILQKPIEMTIEQIEKAFGHKIKIVNSKE